MKRSSLFICIMMAASLLSIFSIKSQDSSESRCDFDGAKIAMHQRVHIILPNQSEKEFCSVSCAKRWIENNPDVEKDLRKGKASITVIDEIYGDEIDSSLAYWVQSDKISNKENNDNYHVFKDPSDAATHINLYNGREIPGLLAGMGEKLNWAKKFKTEDIEGSLKTLDQFENKVVFIRFWSSLNPYFQQDFAYLAESQRRWGETGFVVIAINVDQSKNMIKSAIKGLDLPFIILTDIRGRIADDYGVQGFPTGFVVDRTGIIRNQSIGEILPDLMEPLIAPYL